MGGSGILDRPPSQAMTTRLSPSSLRTQGPPRERLRSSRRLPPSSLRTQGPIRRGFSLGTPSAGFRATTQACGYGSLLSQGRRRAWNSAPNQLPPIQIFKQPKTSRGANPPGVCVNLPPRKQRAWGMPGARCTHGPRAKKSTGVGPQVHRNHPAFPHANGFTACFVLSPVIGLLTPSLPRSLLPGNLTPAPRRQDHTTSPSAEAFSQEPPGGFGTFPAEALAKADQRRSSCAAAASTASRPTSVTIAKRPSEWDGMAANMDVIWGKREGKYFWRGGLDR
jgi:hypothetical protein